MGLPELEPGWITRCKCVRIVDGDTIDVEVTRRLRVRLLDCWAPETNTSEGVAATEHMQQLLRDEPQLVLMMPQADEQMQNDFTFGRVLGHVWVDGEQHTLNELMVEAGHATKRKTK